MKRFAKFASACVAAAAIAFAPFAGAQVLQQVPSDAVVVVKINKLKPVSDRIAAFAQKLGVAAFQPALNDPLGALKAKGKINAGLDENGEAAFVIMNGPKQKGEPPMIVLVPVSDYKAFVGNFADAKTTGDVTTFTGDGKQPTYVANWGKYAAVSAKAELLSKKPTAMFQAGGVTGKELAEKDIVAYFNFKGSRDKMLPEIKKAKEGFMRDFERNYAKQAAPARRPGQAGAAPAPAAAPDPAAMKYMPVVRSLMGRFFDIAEQVVNDADGATWGISITDEGIKSTGLAEFTAGSPSAKTVAEFKGTAEPLLAGLPASKYLFTAGAKSGNSAATVKLIDTFFAPVQQQAAALGADGKMLTDYVAAVKQYVGASQSWSAGMLVPKGQLGQEAIFQMLSVSQGDAKAMLASQKQMMTSQQALTDMFTGPQMKGMMKTSFTPAAKSIDGIEMSQFQTQMNPPAGQNNAQTMQMKQMMTWMYGPQGMNGLTGAVGNDTMVAAIDVTDATVSQLIASAKTKQDVVSPGFAAVNKALPQTRVAAGYFALDQLATTVANYAKMFGMPVNFQLPQNLPPIGGTIATDSNALRADVYVPAQLLQSVIAAGIQSYMQMQGGQAPGGPGGL